MVKSKVEKGNLGKSKMSLFWWRRQTWMYFYLRPYFFIVDVYTNRTSTDLNISIIIKNKETVINPKWYSMYYNVQTNVFYILEVVVL